MNPEGYVLENSPSAARFWNRAISAWETYKRPPMLVVAIQPFFRHLWPQLGERSFCRRNELKGTSEFPLISVFSCDFIVIE